MSLRTFCLTLYTLLLLFLYPPALSAASPAGAPPPPEYFHAQIVSVQVLPPSQPAEIHPPEKIQLVLTSGPDTGKTIQVLHRPSPMKEVVNLQFKEGDAVIVALSHIGGRLQYSIADFERLPYVYALAGLFCIMLFLIGGRSGIKSLIVIALPLFLIFRVMLPLVLAGKENILVVVLLLSLFTASVTQILVSGWNEKTFGAILGAAGGLLAASALSWASIHFMHLSGLESEEAVTLRAMYLPDMNFQDILFAGLLVGALGTVMDTAISVASSQYEVKTARPDIHFRDLFISGVRIGRDIMGTCSNTLILAYLGSFLPLILLIASQQTAPLPVIMNSGLIVTELVRSITGCIGLICTIPITSLTTAFCLTRRG